MSRVVMVRHAQATFSPDREKGFRDYDRLSPLGETQAVALGEELSAAGVVFDRVYVGPATRHRQTADVVGSVFRRLGNGWPEPISAPGLAEHEGASVVDRALGSRAFAQDVERLDALEGQEGVSPVERQRAFFEVFRRVTRQWARGELPDELVEESWQGFRERVAGALEDIIDLSTRGATVGVFTSGGPIGSAVASVLGLTDEKALELAWVLQNATLTEFLYTDGRVSLKSFNVQPRLGSPELYTYV